MHHVIAPSQSIVYPLRLLFAMAAAVSHSNIDRVAFNEPVCSLFIIFSITIRMTYQISKTSLINLRQIICRNRASFRSCIHCIATRVAKCASLKEVNYSPRSSIFHFEFRSQMNLDF